MRKLNNIFIVLLALLMISGCAVKPTNGDETTVDTERIVTEKETPNITPAEEEPDDSDIIWMEYLSSGKCREYINGARDSSEIDYDFDYEIKEYAIMDLNSDGISELLVHEHSWGFGDTFIFAQNGENIVPVGLYYGYGGFRYAEKQNLVVGISEFKPFDGTGYSPFYKFNGKELEEAFTIGIDMGVSFYRDGSGEKTITEEERMAYYDDVISPEWKPLEF